jgi:predicted nucleic acid-binding protein
MILVDTSVWIDHLHQSDSVLVEALEANQVLMHPYVLGELACGRLSNRQELLRLWGELPPAVIATPAEALYYIEQHALMGQGIGYVDVHLLASASLGVNMLLWTHDKRLASIAEGLALSYMR